MKHEELSKRAKELNWFQRLELPTDEGKTIVTSFQADHCDEKIATSRYGIPERLDGLTVLDIGCNNGYHSFLAEKRGAKTVTAIDPNQGDGDNIKCFQLAKEALNSNVNFSQFNLGEYCLKHSSPIGADLVFYFGVLYHVKNPVNELELLHIVTKEYALIETAISQNDYGNRSVWEFNNGFDNDTTNFWYPSLIGLKNVLLYVGFTKVELIWTDGIRCTVKAVK